MPLEGGVFTGERRAIRRSDKVTIHAQRPFGKPCQEVHKLFLVGDDSLGGNERKLIHFLGQRIDLGGRALDHHGDDRHSAVAERYALTADDDFGVLMQHSVQFGRSLSVFDDDADDADQLSALVVLANYATPRSDRVTIPFASGCQSVGLLAFAEVASAYPRAVVGLTDLSARQAVRRSLGPDSLTFTMPWKLFLEMEENAPGCFFDRPTFRSLMGRE